MGSDLILDAMFVFKITMLDVTDMFTHNWEWKCHTSKLLVVAIETIDAPVVFALTVCL